MTTEQRIEKLKDAASFIALFKGSTDGIDDVISDLSGEEYHTTRSYSPKKEMALQDLVLSLLKSQPNPICMSTIIKLCELHTQKPPLSIKGAVHRLISLNKVKVVVGKYAQFYTIY